MRKIEKKEELTETQHAKLFAWIAKETITRLGTQKGEGAILKAVRRYGEQRGRRMALRAAAFGKPLTMTNFLIFGEWRASTDIARQETMVETPDIRTRVLACPWAVAWDESDLMPYGRLYCQAIDEALVFGFNPDLVIDVNQTLTNDGLPCEFLYHSADLPSGDVLSQIQESTLDLEAMTVKPWSYHCGHLYKTCREVLGAELGQLGLEAVQAALDTFAASYGAQAAEILLAHQEVDFDSLL